MPLLTRLYPDRAPYVMVDLPLQGDAEPPVGQPPTGPLAEPLVKTA
jgi:hypothetical protein